MGLEAPAVRDGEAPLEPGSVLLLRGTPNWFPETWRQLAALEPAARPRTVLWLGEPLPMPAAAGLQPERRTPRELAKVLLRDSRRTDPSSNARALGELAVQGLPDRLVVTNEGAA